MDRAYEQLRRIYSGLVIQFVFRVKWGARSLHLTFNACQPLYIYRDRIAFFYNKCAHTLTTIYTKVISDLASESRVLRKRPYPITCTSSFGFCKWQAPLENSDAPQWSLPNTRLEEVPKDATFPHRHMYPDVVLSRLFHRDFPESDKA